MEEPALKKSKATKYKVYFPFNKDDEDFIIEISKKVLGFITKVFGGATVYKAQGTTTTWGEALTYVLEIVVEDVEYKETRIEQLAWLILCYLDNLKLSRGKPPEETVWFFEQPVTLYKLRNPELLKGGEP